ncbi:LOW QUALITY PROTEIN: hypothetical protein PanWU01x14_269820 [Parasponia andersonii]|uniref:Uncharacterized protein n=1 Tax=Parasponia andersonii TaxID=3476 RepID=A0A2P5B5I6_PARAD|nr:LOW QUALITY PROTEIN: hypothetical protein PanWU01x14_269820 [Parasponia andersonii]
MYLNSNIHFKIQTKNHHPYFIILILMETISKFSLIA